MTSLGPHTRPACNQATVDNLLNPKRWFWPQYSVFFIDFRWCEGSGASFHCLRMRSRSTRKCAHMNAGDLGSILAVYAGQKHWTELRMRPTTTQLGVFLWMRMFFTACQTFARWLVERSREQSDDVSYANESRDPQTQYPYCLSRALIRYYLK